MAAVRQSRFLRRVAETSKAVAALTGLLEHVAELLRQVLHVAGWLVLLWGSVALPFQAHPSPAHLVAPGAGMAAVFQGLVAGRLRHRKSAAGWAGNDKAGADDGSVHSRAPIRVTRS